MQHSTFIGRYLPQRLSDRNGACERGKFAGVVTVGADRVIVPAIAGKCLFVPYINVYSSTTAAIIVFKTASGNSLAVRSPDSSSGSPNATFPPNEYGWIDTLPGEQILADVSGVNVIVSLQWFAYLP